MYNMWWVCAIWQAVTHIRYSGWGVPLFSWSIPVLSPVELAWIWDWFLLMSGCRGGIDPGFDTGLLTNNILYIIYYYYILYIIYYIMKMEKSMKWKGRSEIMLPWLQRTYMSVEVRHGFIKLQTFQNVFLAVPRYDIIKTIVWKGLQHNTTPTHPTLPHYPRYPYHTTPHPTLQTTHPISHYTQHTHITTHPYHTTHNTPISHCTLHIPYSHSKTLARE